MTWQKRGKYGNKKSVSGDGTKFDSQGEMHRWFQLQQMEQQGLIRNLRRQVPYELFGLGGTKICALVVDFDYFEGGTHIQANMSDYQPVVHVVEDWKAVKTADFKLKERLFKDNHPGISLRLTGAWKKIEDKARAKARMKYAEKKMLLAMTAEKE